MAAGDRGLSRGGCRLPTPDLAGLYFEIEAGTIGESDVYSDLEKQIEQLGEDTAMAIRDKAAVNRHEWLQPHQPDPAVCDQCDELAEQIDTLLAEFPASPRTSTDAEEG